MRTYLQLKLFDYWYILLHKWEQINVKYNVHTSFNYISKKEILFRWLGGWLGSVMVSYAGIPCSIANESRIWSGESHFYKGWWQLKAVESVW
jgi:hypothetical protein